MLHLGWAICLVFSISGYTRESDLSAWQLVTPVRLWLVCSPLERRRWEACERGLCFWSSNLEMKKRDSCEYFMAGNMRRRQCNSCKTSSSSSFMSKDQKKKKKHLRAKQRNGEHRVRPTTSKTYESWGSLWLSLSRYVYIYILLTCLLGGFLIIPLKHLSRFKQS